MTAMRAKVVVTAVAHTPADQYSRARDEVSFRAVCKEDGPYPADGTDENNTFALWSPQADMKFTILNPALIGGFKVGDKFYANFAPELSLATIGPV